jgi:hypothetical protein
MKITTTLCLSALLAGCAPLPSTEGTESAALGGGSTIVSAIGSKCLDDSGDKATNGNKIQLWDCNGTAAQSWTYTNETLVGPGGKCLDITSDAQVSGTKVDLYTCNGTNAQKWTVSGSTIKSTGGLCLDVTSGKNADGTQVELYACNGTSSQSWKTSFGSSAPPTPTPDMATTPPPVSSGSTFWVYHQGVFNWGGDYSFAATADYKDTSGEPEDGAYDIKVSVTSAWGGFQPYAGGTVPTWDFNDAGYNYLEMDLKPTVDDESYSCLFHKVGDIAIGNGVTIEDYGPKPTKGVWSHYKIPLADVGVENTPVYKFFIQDKTGLATNTFYVDDIGFTAE